MQAELRNFSAMLDDLSKASGLHFVWHFVDTERKEDIVDNQTNHRCPFCLKIKMETSRKYLRKCISEHHEIEFREALKHRSPFVIHCHAGAMELAVPIFIKEEFIGVLTAGTFRYPASAGYPGFEKERENLPVIQEKDLAKWGKVLTSLAEQYLSGLHIASNSDPLLKQTLCLDTRILKAIAFLRYNFTRKIMVKEAAKEAGMCISRFLHVFTKETGYSFSDFLQRIRVEHARRLVEGSDLSLEEIARCSGINSQSRMGVLFRRYLNTSPRELRKRYRTFCELQTSRQ